jgi:ATP-dependent DNA ligase
MLAQTFDISLYEGKHTTKKTFLLSFPMIVQRKIDGIRCISSTDKNGKVQLFSRNGIHIMNFSEIEKSLTMLFTMLDNQSCYIDGELFTDKVPFEQINGIVRRENKTETSNVIEYHIYDIYDPNNTKWTCHDRMLFLQDMKRRHVFPRIHFLNYDIVNNCDDIRRYQTLFINEGFEGIMLREMDSVYEKKKRSKFLQKFKLFMEEEFVIIGYKSGTKAEQGCVIWICQTRDKKTFSVRPRGTVAEKKVMFKNGNDYIGKLLTVIFQEYTSDGLPRFCVGKDIRDPRF